MNGLELRFGRFCRSSEEEENMEFTRMTVQSYRMLSRSVIKCSSCRHFLRYGTMHHKQIIKLEMLFLGKEHLLMS